MAKAIKYKNGAYLDSSCVNYKRNNLKSIVDSILSNPIGEFILWEGEKEVIENDTWHYLGEYYWLKAKINLKFPIKQGFNRIFRICLESTDNISSGNYTYIKLSQNNYSKEYLFGNVQGATNSGVRTIQIMNFDYDGLPDGHITFHITPSFATNGSTMRIYKLYLLIYDTIE